MPGTAAQHDGATPRPADERPDAAGPDPVGVGVDLDARIRLHPLTYLPEGDEVTVGCAATDSYAVLPADGAELLRRLGEGCTLGEGASWYLETYGESVDLGDFLEALGELDFLAPTGEAAAEAAGPARPVRWARLGRLVFSPLSGLLLLALAVLTAVAMAEHHDLVPANNNLFFTKYMSVIELVTFLGQIPLLLLHESFHALAGRRLGLSSRLTIGRRLYYIVFLTEMDGLVAVPRRKRFLPMLAGMLADLLVIMLLTLAADLTRHPDGRLGLAGGILLATSYMTVLRLIWQFFLYLETDLYYVAVTVLGCVDLQGTARAVLRNRWNRLVGRPERMTDPELWHPRDRAAARWYSWLLLAGWTFSFGSLGFIVVPIAVRVFGRVLGRLADPGTQSVGGLLDSAVFLSLNLAQLGFALWLALQERRRRHAAGAAAAATTPS
ncbi:hypothetical protein [Kitasatospora viridis]|uniref:Peptide zinc metalloprotease protein n=1 Tax=Kitasatospora viridis TaxID=281105 RepID=A0A561SDF3_9ACTN|nr:hypothetical protein [Kitasatospora viridis]TWF72874.1 hypothetical protein FHX73_1625 [Kitasatospora viridis]